MVTIHSKSFEGQLLSAGEQCSLGARIGQPIYSILAQVCWPNIGSAATGPAVPAPMALDYAAFNKLKAHVVLGREQGVGMEQGCRDILHLYVVQPVCCFKLG